MKRDALTKPCPPPREVVLITIAEARCFEIIRLKIAADIDLSMEDQALIDCVGERFLSGHSAMAAAGQYRVERDGPVLHVYATSACSGMSPSARASAAR